MSQIRSFSYVAALALCMAACQRKPESSTSPGASTSPGTSTSPGASASARAPGASGAVAKNARRGQGKCPNWVPGAKSEYSETEGGAVLVITAPEQPAVTAIRERARYLAEGKSKGGDGTGQCPVIRDARLETADVEGGARVILRPTDTLDLDKLRTEVRARLARSLQ